MILNHDDLQRYIEKFNHDDDESVIQYIDNQSAWSWLRNKIPLFECPDPELQETYYFRWWVFRKHLKKTSDGLIITEFHPNVPWAGKHNSIVSAIGHHLGEGRWLNENADFIHDYIFFWFRKGGSLRSYSVWLADAIWNYASVTGDFRLGIELLPDLVNNYQAWEASNRHTSGLFWSHDDRDAMEFSISGPGLRPTLNSYMYGDAKAIAEIAKMKGQVELAAEFIEKAETLKELIQKKLWDSSAEFFKVIPLEFKNKEIYSWDFSRIDPTRNVRELIGFIPWYFNLPSPGYEMAWKELMSYDGFYAPYGPTTAERRHPRFMFNYPNHECLWNGPSWPFATTQTLIAMINLLNNYKQKIVTKKDFFELLKIYTRCHHRKKSDGKIVNWLDENLDPFTGEWLSRKILKKWEWRIDKGGPERGKDYNHSGYCDLIISGLIGIRPRSDNTLEINPLVPEELWDYFCIDQVPYHERQITVIYDKTGKRYQKGIGLRVFVDGHEVGKAETISKMKCKL